MGRKKKERIRRRWEVSVKRGEVEVGVVYVRAIEKRWATRIGVIFMADEEECGTSELTGEAVEKPTGSLEILPEEYEYIACFQKEGVIEAPKSDGPVNQTPGVTGATPEAPVPGA